MKRILSLLLVCLFLFSCAAAETKSEKAGKDIIDKAITLYGEGAVEQAEALVEETASLYPALYTRWRSIFDCWKRLDAAELAETLPEGLPDTDELCIVVLGYALSSNGKMREELYKRLEVALACAQQYPNAYILCTGGHTASQAPDASEAGRMGDWLRRKGVSRERIIEEKNSLNTTENARFTYDILTKKYPSVKALAVISSDYHVRSGAMILEAAGTLLTQGEPVFHVLACAACAVRPETVSTGYAVTGLRSLLRNS